MKDRNICKFNGEHIGDALNIENFIYETRCTQAEPQIRPYNIINLVLRGEGVYRRASQSFCVTPGTMFFSFTGNETSVDGTADFEYMYISFTGRRSDELFRRFGISEDNCVFTGYENLIPFWQDSLSRAGENTIDLLSESVLLYSLSKLSTSQGSRDDLLNEILYYIDLNFGDPELTLETLAEAFSYSPKYISHLFKKQMNVGFVQYLRSMRIKHAITLMECGVMSVKNVALLSGYTDALYFSKLFREQIGISPSEYIEKNRRHS